MVYLNRITTGGGDAGETTLGDGTRVPKTHPRIVAYGSVDELNCVLGVVLASGVSEDIAGRLRDVQNDLFDLGADLCIPERADQQPEKPPLRLTAGQVERLEQWIEETNRNLPPLRSFLLPGGSPAAAHLHLARGVCRRVEIEVLRLAETEPINKEVLRYLNRLSDLLFVLARWSNRAGENDVLWVPGEGRAETD